MRGVNSGPSFGVACRRPLLRETYCVSSLAHPVLYEGHISVVLPLKLETRGCHGVEQEGRAINRISRP